jgi:hypothetical protein
MQINLINMRRRFHLCIYTFKCNDLQLCHCIFKYVIAFSNLFLRVVCQARRTSHAAMFGKWRGPLKLGQALQSNVLIAAFGLTISPSLTPGSLAELDESGADAAVQGQAYWQWYCTLTYWEQCLQASSANSMSLREFAVIEKCNL